MQARSRRHVLLEEVRFDNVKPRLLQTSKAVQRLLLCELHDSSCDSWHPPVCQNYKSQSDCKFGEKCSFLHSKFDRHPNKRPKKGGGKGSVALLKNATQLGCVVQDVETLKLKSVLRRAQNSWDPRAVCNVQSVRYAALILGKKKSVAGL